MGKSRSKTSNQSYVTQSEMVNHFGGKTSQSLAEKKSIFKRLPFDCEQHAALWWFVCVRD